MRVYISGPISSDPDYAEKFAAAFERLEKAGYDPVNPVAIGKVLKYKMGREPTWEDYMRACIKGLMDCDAIFMLGGGLKSDGAKLELQLAEELNMKRITLEGNDNGNKESL